MFARTTKKKKHPFLAIGIGAMAIFGVYSAVTTLCDTCREKMKALMKAMKKKKCHSSSEMTDEDGCEDCDC